MVYGIIVEVFLQKLSQWYCDASPEAPSPEYTASGDYRSSAPGGSGQGPSSRLTVAEPPESWSGFAPKVHSVPPKTGDLERFRDKSTSGHLQSG